MLAVYEVRVFPDFEQAVMLSCTFDIPDPQPLPATGQKVGIDLGLRDFLVLSNGERIPNPEDMNVHEQRLKCYQRILARKQRGSANRVKATLKAASRRARVADARGDFLDKTSTDLIRRFDGIAVEDLAVRNMVRNCCLAELISRSGWGEFGALLIFETQRYGRILVLVDRFS